MSDSVNEALLLQRIDRLEATLSALTGATANSHAGGKPPKPTGLTFNTSPGIIAFEWDPVFVSDLKYYVIQIAENEGMTGAFETTTTDPRYTYYAGVPGVTYYARVRTVNRSDAGSDWTAVESSEVGLVDSTLLDTASNIILNRFVKTSGFTALDTGAGGTDDETYGPMEVTCDGDHSIVDIKIACIGLLDVGFPSSGQPCYFLLTLLRRAAGAADQTVWEVQRDYSYARGGSGSPTEAEYIAFPPIAEEPGEGTWEYRFKVTITTGGSNRIQFTGTDLRILAVVFN